MKVATWLQVHLKVLPQLAEHWNKPDDRDAEPSKFATDLARVSSLSCLCEFSHMVGLAAPRQRDVNAETEMSAR